MSIHRAEPDPNLEIQQRLDALRLAMTRLGEMPNLVLPHRYSGQQVEYWFEGAAYEIERWAKGVNECRDRMQRALEGEQP